MKLIAKKPCSFGGRQFYIGDEIPAGLVADPVTQEGLGVIAIANTGSGGEPDGQMFTQEQVEKMLEEAVEEAVNNTVAEMKQEQEELAQAKKESAEGIVINLRGWDYSETGKATDVTATPEQIQHTFGILQCTAEDGAKHIADITDETVLLLIHAADSRKTVKNAAKEQRDKLSSTKEETNGATGGNAATDTHTEGS